MTHSKSDLGSPTWNNETEYKSIASPEYKNDFLVVSQNIKLIHELSSTLKELIPKAENLTVSETPLKQLREISNIYWQGHTLIYNLNTFISCLLSNDGENAEARQEQSKAKNLSSQFTQATQAFFLMMMRLPENIINEYLAGANNHEKFFFEDKRKLRDTLLSLDEENLITALSTDGISAWGTLYTNITSSVRVNTLLENGETQSIGLATAAGLLKSSDAKVRENAWKNTNNAWTLQEESCSSVINALAGWRLEIYKKRSHTRALNFIDAPLHQNRIDSATLTTMMSAIERHKEVAQRALKLQARALKKETLAPWDLFAPSPFVQAEKNKMPFADALKLIKKAFSRVNPEMGHFVDMMAENQWIEATQAQSKRTGAYCTEFAKSRTPRVYMSYDGSSSSVGTLAHELGHAFHAWVMRDMPYSQSSYPMTLAETASIFAECVLADELASSATSANDSLSAGFENAGDAGAFLLNIPARFMFESNVYQKRVSGTLSPKDFKTLMTDAWTSWYGNSLSEMDPMFWCSKLHFHISGLSFYNFPYSFGYLFSHGVYALSRTQGSSFYKNYVSLLRDTGSMNSEQLALKHLGVDLRKPDFWNASLAIVKEKIDSFEKHLNANVK